MARSTRHFHRGGETSELEQMFRDKGLIPEGCYRWQLTIQAGRRPFVKCYMFKQDAEFAGGVVEVMQEFKMLLRDEEEI